MSSVRTVPVAALSKMASNLRRWSVRSWASLEKVPSILMFRSCWKTFWATAKLEDLECSSLAIMYMA
jgi:hypothetical protein